MSKTSAKARYVHFMEFHDWAKSKYPNWRIKKKKVRQ